MNLEQEGQDFTSQASCNKEEESKEACQEQGKNCCMWML
jgi:hypothetical protein